MPTVNLLERLLYLDRDFVSSYYECISGQSAATQFTRQEGKKAGAQIPIFSAELSAVEIKSYGISSLEMLQQVLSALGGYPKLDLSSLEGTKQTAYGWIEGSLSTATTKRSRKANDGSDEVLAEERYFTLHVTPTASLALITSETYFSSGINALARLQTSMLKDFSLRVRALVRALPSTTHGSHRIAVPLLLLEADVDG